MKKELLLGTALIGVSLNAGLVESADAQVAPATTLTVCHSGGGQFATIHEALRAIAGDYSRPYDVQICPGTYPEAPGRIDFNGTIEGMGRVPDDVLVQDTQAAGTQYYFAVGTESSPYPGETMTVKDFHVDGTVFCHNGSPSCKAARCFQLQSAGLVQFDNMHITDCQDGILGNTWSPPDGSGIVIISGSKFNNNCSDAGPSHSIYINLGTVDVGGTITVNGTAIAAQPNTFGECNYGYNVKLRPFLGIVEHNNFVQNFTVASSAAIDDSEGGTLVVRGNTMTFGPQTGQNNQPPQAILLGGILGKNIPASYTIDHNSIVLSGVTKRFVPISSIDNNPDVVVTNNTFPPRSALGPHGILQGQGTIGAGNIYADGSAVSRAVQDSAFDDTTLLADYRGTSWPHNVSVPFPTKTVWGGNGKLTVSAPGYAVIGGPGGVDITRGALWVWTNPASISNRLALSAGFQTFDYGANDRITVSGRACGHGNPINVLGGSTTLSFASTTQTPACAARVYQGATLTAHDSGATGSNSGNSYLAYKGSSLHVDGTAGHDNVDETDASVVVNGLTIVPSGTAAPQAFTFSIRGGWINSGPKVVASGGKIRAVDGWQFVTYDAGPTDIPTITLNGTTGAHYTIKAAGGAVVYAGDNKVDIGGSGRGRGPAPEPVTYLVQSSASGSVVDSGFGRLNVYLDGSGTVKVSRANRSAQPIYLEIDSNSSGSVEISNPWRRTVDVCHLNGATIARQGALGSNYVVRLTNGGTVQFDRTSSVRCS